MLKYFAFDGVTLHGRATLSTNHLKQRSGVYSNYLHYTLIREQRFALWNELYVVLEKRNRASKVRVTRYGQVKRTVYIYIVKIIHVLNVDIKFKCNFSGNTYRKTAFTGSHSVRRTLNDQIT